MALRWSASIDHFARFRFDEPERAAGAHARSNRDLIRILIEGLSLPEADIGEPFGDETLGMVSITFGRGFGAYDVNVGVSGDGLAPGPVWELHVQVHQPGMLERSWRPKLESMKLVEQRLHDRLLALGARDLWWRVQDSRKDPGQPTP